ncbi:hypothetical protein ASF11_07685 [Acidovorax sp. Leaf76]|jgi:hypothetical protein|uniref:hypothetical protein n=1 Tax=unclassified Acidovorax TaxID=2684926 RepID=UPI000700F513|nr:MULTISPECIES: hypothetical protein [unclassified Acidovorax]KQO22249.1 hypothetical protein ASF11_07685 [Acidovorax sp. Leaf76]KQO35317.1 hypothetical protein ASF19_06560 [Acidovorax sp. Leaf84]KQS35099.1 hypothetical protein ASG27_06800 [Acidovorax sp. Leaf191]RZJ62495.1 MAG: hypothetical protein EON49_02060 [Acidovorax sp.]
MLTFAAPSAPAQNRGADFSLTPDESFASPRRAAAFIGMPHHGTYWPCDLLNLFVLKMAAAGHCVNTDMMLGHRPYAQGRLNAAYDSRDESLCALAARLQVYFDAATPEGCRVAAELDEQGRGHLLLV